MKMRPSFFIRRIFGLFLIVCLGLPPSSVFALRQSQPETAQQRSGLESPLTAGLEEKRPTGAEITELYRQVGQVLSGKDPASRVLTGRERRILHRFYDPFALRHRKPPWSKQRAIREIIDSARRLAKDPSSSEIIPLSLLSQLMVWCEVQNRPKLERVTVRQLAEFANRCWDPVEEKVFDGARLSISGRVAKSSGRRIWYGMDFSESRYPAAVRQAIRELEEVIQGMPKYKTLNRRWRNQPDGKYRGPSRQQKRFDELYRECQRLQLNFVGRLMELAPDHGQQPIGRKTWLSLRDLGPKHGRLSVREGDRTLGELSQRLRQEDALLAIKRLPSSRLLLQVVSAGRKLENLDRVVRKMERIKRDLEKFAQWLQENGGTVFYNTAGLEEESELVVIHNQAALFPEGLPVDQQQIDAQIIKAWKSNPNKGRFYLMDLIKRRVRKQVRPEIGLTAGEQALVTLLLETIERHSKFRESLLAYVANAQIGVGVEAVQKLRKEAAALLADTDPAGQFLGSGDRKRLINFNSPIFGLKRMPIDKYQEIREIIASVRASAQRLRLEEAAPRASAQRRKGASGRRRQTAGLEEKVSLGEILERARVDLPLAGQQEQPLRFIVDTSQGEPKVLRLLQLAVLLEKEKGLRVQAAGVATAQELAAALDELPDETSRLLLESRISRYVPGDPESYQRATEKARKLVPGLHPEAIITEINRLTVGWFLETIEILGIWKLSSQFKKQIDFTLTAA